MILNKAKYIVVSLNFAVKKFNDYTLLVIKVDSKRKYRTTKSQFFFIVNRKNNHHLYLNFNIPIYAFK